MRCAIALMIMSAPALLNAHKGLSPLDDKAMSGIVGQAGIALDLEWTINADNSGNPLASLDYCSGINEPCRMSFQFDNRSSAGGEWITWKNFYGVLRLNNIWIDAGQTPSSSSDYADTALNNRFMSGDATPICLLNGSTIASTCHQGTLDMPMLALQFNSGNESGLELFLNIGSVAVEYGTTGYLNDANEPALGVLIGDVRGTDLQNPVAHPAEIKIGGTMGLYGF